MKQTIRLSGLVEDSIVDGPGFRLSVFTQGCPHHCAGCHNPQTHDFAGGYDVSAEDILGKLTKNPMQKGITLSGGEPFAQAEALLPLCRRVKELGKDIWVYSGYTFEELTAPGGPPHARALLALCDVLVDGRFLSAKRNLNLWFRGSENQRVIDLPQTLASGSVVLFPLDEQA